MRLGLLLMLVWTLAGSAFAAPQPPPGPPLVLGHRGIAWNHAGNPYPENTLLSVDAALAAGAHGVEVDVVRTADDAIVLRHDDHLGTTSPDGLPRSNCRGWLSRKTWGEVAHCRARPFAEDGLDAPFSRLEELLTRRDLSLLIIDVKDDSVGTRGRQSVTTIVELLEAAAYVPRAVLMLYHADSVAYARSLGVRACLKHHSADAASPDEVAEQTRRAGAWASCDDSRLVNAPLMAALGARGLGQLTFHLGNTPGAGYDKRMRALFGLGVTAVITDLAGRAVELRRKLRPEGVADRLATPTHRAEE